MKDAVKKVKKGSRKKLIKNNDKVTIGLYRIQEGTSFRPGIKENDFDQIKTMAGNLRRAARKAGRQPPEIVVSILLVPDWKNDSSYTDADYQKAKEQFFASVQNGLDRGGVTIEDFYAKESLTVQEKSYLEGLEAGGSNADMIKTHAIICPENQDRRHLQLDSNTKIIDYDAFYNDTFNAKEQKDALNASYYDFHYVSAHNKIVYTTPGGKIAPALREVHLQYCADHKDDHLHENTEREKKIINGQQKNSIYSKDFTVALKKVGLTANKTLPGPKTIYPAVMTEPEYRLTKHMFTAVNMSWKPKDPDEAQALAGIADKLKNLPSKKIGQATVDFASYENAVKKYTGELTDHVDDEPYGGKKEAAAHQQLLSISNQKSERRMIKAFIENTFKKRPDMIVDLVRKIPNTERGNKLVQDLYGKTATVEKLYARAEEAKINHINKASNNSSASKSLSADEQREEMADVKRNEMAKSAFGQGSNTAKEIASFPKQQPAVPVGVRGYGVANTTMKSTATNADTIKTRPH